MAKRGAAAAICVAAGVTTIAGQLSQRSYNVRSTGALPIDSLHALGIAGGIGLFVLAHGLWRGKRRAVDIAAITLVVIAVVRLLLDSMWIGPALAAGLAALLAFNRGAFNRGSAPRPRRVLLSGTLALIAAAVLYSLHTAAVLATHRHPDVDKVAAHAAHAGRAVVAGAQHAALAHPTALLSLTTDALVALLVIAGAAALRGLLRPVQANEGHGPEEHARALQIVRDEGRDSLDPLRAARGQGAPLRRGRLSRLPRAARDGGRLRRPGRPAGLGR